MTKKKIIRKSNRTLNLYPDGGIFETIGSYTKNTPEVIGGVAQEAGNLVGGLASNGLSSTAGNIIGEVGKIAGAINPIIGAGISVLGGVVNGLFGSNLNNENIQQIENNTRELGNTIVDNKDNNSIMSQWGNQSFGIDFSQRDVGRDGLFSNKAKKKYNALKANQGIAIDRMLSSYDNAIKSADTQSDLIAMRNFAAYGGPLYFIDGGAVDYELAKEDLYNKRLNALNKSRMYSMPNSFINSDTMFKEGGKIHIKKANRGKFTDYCGGKVTAECIAKGKRSSSPAVRKRATFAANARKWHHSLGGYLFKEGGNLYEVVPNIGQHGGNFSNGVTIIGNGGTHEENPMEGVPMGIAPDGSPNLVEEGEVKYNDYIFSNRLFATDKVLKENNLSTTYTNHSFADIAERLSKESSERPNDPISKRGLHNSLIKLQMAQEQLKVTRDNKRNRKYATGGPLGMDPDLENPEVVTGSKLSENPYYEDSVVNPVVEPQSFPSIKSRRPINLSYLRYAPVLGAGLGVISDLAGWTNKPDYSNAELVGRSVDNLSTVDYKPIGNYLTYKPLDRNYYTNKLAAQAGATRRAVMNLSGGNRATAVANLLAADYVAQGRLGDLARQAEEYNLAQRERVETFNRGTNQFNSEMAYKTAMANKQNEEMRFRAATQEAQLRDQADMRSASGKSANLTNFFDSLGDIGREEFSRNMIMSNPALYYTVDSSGKISYKKNFENLTDDQKAYVRKQAESKASRAKRKNEKSNGGYLTIK